jgi:hypothetical protein
MGWRTQNAYDEEAEARRRLLPWRERYNWPGVLIFALAICAVAVWLVVRG